MSEPIAVVVPKELYYHEVGYVRGLEARVAKLEEVIQTQNGVVVSGTLKLNEARARVAELEAALAEKTGEAERQYDYNVSQIARVAKLEAALISMTKGANWKSADKDNMEFEGRVNCYQLDRARAALEDAP